MSERNLSDRSIDEWRDEDVSARYHTDATETAPEHLDDAVLRHAETEVSRDRWQLRYHPWLRPIALAATVALSLAVLLDVLTPSATDSQVLQDFSSAADEATDRIRDIGETAAASRPPGDPVATRNEAGRYCDAADTESPERWWECVLTLRERGLAAEADAELRRLESEYPDFTPPPRR